MDVEGVPPAREICVITKAHGGSPLRSIDSVAIRGEPRTDSVEYANSFNWDSAIGFRTNVEQIVAALLSACGQIVHDPLWGLPFTVGALITPTEVEGVTRLPRTVVGLNFMLGC